MDSHLAELTVKETMDFSARAQGPGTKRGALPSHPARGAASCGCASGTAPDRKLQVLHTATPAGTVIVPVWLAMAFPAQSPECATPSRRYMCIDRTQL